MGKPDRFELIAETARRRGFFWPSFEIYGGVGGFIDLGPLGSVMLRRIEEKWRDFFIRKHGFLEISTPVVMPAKVFEASGHLEHFKDPMVECLSCRRRFRADQLLKASASVETEGLGLEELDEQIRAKGVRCVECGGELSKPQYFRTMFSTTIGPYSDSVGFGRPEAAQGMFINFRRLHEVSRGKLPIGIAQIGTALRNEISPRQGPIRLREFTIMEFEFFFDPENSRCPNMKEVEDETLRIVSRELREKGVEEPVELTVGEALRRGYIVNEWLAYFMALSKSFLVELGVASEKQRFHEKLKGERAHYSAQTYDQEIFLDRWGWVEVSGHAYRADYDLTGHVEHSGVDLRVFVASDKPVERKVKVAAPNASVIGPLFKDNAERVTKIISGISPDLLEAAFRDKGYHEVEGYRILPEHVNFKLREVKETGRKFIPHVVEPSFGAERLLYVILEQAYSVREGRVVLRIPRDLAPVQAVVLPLVSKDGLPEKAIEIQRMLVKESLDVEYDDSGAIGRRYARADEAGTPVAITVDYQTLKDNTVTLRDRDSWKQVRVSISHLPQLLRNYLAKKISLDTQL